MAKKVFFPFINLKRLNYYITCTLLTRFPLLFSTGTARLKCRHFIAQNSIREGRDNLVWGRIQRKAWCMGLYAGVDYITSPYVPSRVHIYHGQPYARVDLNPMPESTLFPSQGLRFWPLECYYLLFLLYLLLFHEWGGGGGGQGFVTKKF